MESNNKYWKGFEELYNEPEFVRHKRDEFKEELPVFTDLKQLATEQPASRRDFLKVLGFSLSAAAVAASCEIPVRKAIPYVVKPEEIVPGIANYYASTFLNGSDFCSILVKTREGRPIKIEGNTLSGLTGGGTSARAQASVVSLYDGARLRSPQKGGQKVSWAIADTEIKQKLAATQGDIVILTPALVSPTTRQVIRDFQAQYPRARQVSYEAISNAGMLYANEQLFGRKAIPSYNFDKADVIVSIGADFLGTWLSPVEFARQYVKNRKITKDSPRLSKHWQFESYMSLAGSKADKRLSVRPSEEGLVAAALYAELSGAGGAALKDAEVSKAIKQAALELKAAQGKALVVAGSNDPNVQTIVNAINGLLGSYGNTIDFSRPYNVHTGDDQAMNALVAAMNGGSVGALLIYGVNPAYNYHKADQFVAGLKKVALTVSFNDRRDETSEHVTYLCPDNHYLESWNDAEPKKGYFSLGQPTISPLFDTRQAQESLLRWAGNNATYYDYLRANWQQSIYSRQSQFKSFQAFWDASLHDGIFEMDAPNKTTGAKIGGAMNNGAVQDSLLNAVRIAAPAGLMEASAVTNGNFDTAAALAAVNAAASKAANGIELKLYENAMIGDGSYANNPFLQESPEPISKVCWDNFVAVSKKFADEQGWVEKDIIKVSANGYSVELPLIFQPGQLHGTASIALGYGRTKAGNERCNVGKNAYPFVGFNGKTFDYNLGGVTLEKVGSGYSLARTQTHHTIDDARPIIRTAALPDYVADNYAGNHDAKHFKDHPEHFFTLYGDDPLHGPHADRYTRGHHWALNVDLNLCIGCGACVPACHIENNVPIVGQHDVVRVHEMHWMRIDRYYFGDPENPTVTYMPMMCQHCDSAPCENVCPVAATNHSSEGINQMAYNRCIGTRYCANNCPYKVRRFNWFDYQGADSFYADTIFDNDEWNLSDDLTRMVLNPDVTVRSRGVMEKCSFCIQRIQEGKLGAKKAGRKLNDGEIKSACQQACPTNAITFGDRNDETTAIAQIIQDERNYYLLEELHIAPSVSYLTQIRNTEADPKAKKHHGGEHKKDEAHPEKTEADTHGHGG